MRVYVGQTRSRSLIARLAEHGFGEMTVREEFPPRRMPWALDNGAFKDWRAGRVFDADAFRKALASASAFDVPPDFVVAPDIVAGGWASLNRSRTWRRDCERALPGVPVYLAVQDGMGFEVAQELRDGFGGIFVGGSLAWKLRTAAGWVGAAQAMGRPCHVGRIGTRERVEWCRYIGADSIDSCLPLWSESNLEAFLLGFSGTQPKAREMSLQASLPLGLAE